MPARSTQTSCRRSPPPARCASTPVADTANAPRNTHRPIRRAWATGIGSPLTTPRVGSKRCATSTPWRTHSSAPGGAYTAAVSVASTRVGSPPSSVPTYTPRVSGVPYPTKKRKCRPSGRNCGQRWLAWPGACRVTATGVPPVAITRISGRRRRRGANTMTPSRFHVPPRPLGASASTCEAAASQIDPLQLAVGKKADRAAIRRPERIAGSLGARERLRRHLVERPHPEPRRALGRRDERQLPAVGRQRERYRIARRRRRDLKARRKWLGYNATEVQRGGDCQRRGDHERQRRDDPCDARTAPCARLRGDRPSRFPPLRR